MNIKLKKKGFIFQKKMNSDVSIDDIIVKEDIINPENEKINIYFRGKDSSGILIFSKDELEKLKRSLKSSTGLIKKSGKIRA